MCCNDITNNMVTFKGAVGTVKEEIPCTSVWAATGLEAVVWSLPGFDLFNLRKTLITISCSIGRIPVHQFGVYWKHPKASKPRSSPWSRWGQKKNIRDSVLIGVMQGVSRIFHRWEHKRDAGQVDSHALPSRQVLLWTTGLYCHPPPPHLTTMQLPI